VTEKNLKAGQQITLDASLQDLLNPPEGTQITFLNIQKYINPHYIKPVVAAAPVVAAVEPTVAAAADVKKPAAARPSVKKPATKA